MVDMFECGLRSSLFRLRYKSQLVDDTTYSKDPAKLPGGTINCIQIVNWHGVRVIDDGIALTLSMYTESYYQGSQSYEKNSDSRLHEKIYKIYANSIIPLSIGGSPSIRGDG